MSTQLYTQAYVSINGKVLFEHANVTVKRSSGSSPVTTVARGYAGEQIGAPITSIDVSNAVPVAGFEFNAQDHVETLEVVEIGVIAAGVALSQKGFIVEDSFHHAANGEAGYDFSWRGNFAKFE